MNIPWIVMGNGRGMVRADQIQGVKTSVRTVPVSKDKNGCVLNVYVIAGSGEDYLYTQVFYKDGDCFPTDKIDMLTQNVLDEIRENINTAIEDASIDPCDNLKKIYRGTAPRVFGHDNNNNENKE